MDDWLPNPVCHHVPEILKPALDIHIYFSRKFLIIAYPWGLTWIGFRRPDQRGLPAKLVGAHHTAGTKSSFHKRDIQNLTGLASHAETAPRRLQVEEVTQKDHVMVN